MTIRRHVFGFATLVILGAGACAPDDAASDPVLDLPADVLEALDLEDFTPLTAETRPGWAIDVLTADPSCAEPGLRPLEAVVAEGEALAPTIDDYLASFDKAGAFETVISDFANDVAAFDGATEREAEAILMAALHRLAIDGDRAAMNELGIAQYRCYQGVQRDACAAVAWLGDARLDGDRLATASVGYMTFAGIGYARNKVVATNLLRYAARHGDEDAGHVMAAYEAGELDDLLSQPEPGPVCAP